MKLLRARTEIDQLLIIQDCTEKISVIIKFYERAKAIGIGLDVDVDQMIEVVSELDIFLSVMSDEILLGRANIKDTRKEILFIENKVYTQWRYIHIGRFKAMQKTR